MKTLHEVALAPLAPRGITPRQKKIALAVALCADLLQIAVFPLFVEGGLSPFDAALDALVALTLVLTLGWRWRTVLALGLELAPGLALFPSWTTFVATFKTTPADRLSDTSLPVPALPPDTAR